MLKIPNTTSSVWNHFRLKGDDDLPISKDVDKPVCRHCKKTVFAKRSNMMNSFCHLEDHHPDIYFKLQRGKTVIKKQPMPTEFIKKSKMYDPKSKRVCDLNDSVARFLAQDMQPFYTPEKSGFEQMVKMLDPKYSLPS